MGEFPVKGLTGCHVSTKKFRKGFDNIVWESRKDDKKMQGVKADFWWIDEMDETEEQNEKNNSPHGEEK